MMVYPYNVRLLVNQKKPTTDICTAWMDVKRILLSGRSQAHKDTHCMIHAHDMLEKAKLYGQERNQWFLRAGGWERA